MPNRWFRVPEVSIRIGPYDSSIPKYHHRVEGYAGTIIDTAPKRLVRFYGDASTLDGIADELDTSEVSITRVSGILNTVDLPHLPDIEWTDETINQRFRA